MVKSMAVVLLVMLGLTTLQEDGKEKGKKPAEGKPITVRFTIALDSESQITVDEQPCSLAEAETLYKFTAGSLITTEMKVTDGKATLLKVTTRK